MGRGFTLKRCAYAGAVALASVFGWTAPAPAMIVIAGDTGGPISHYERLYAMVRASGEYVVIDGRCFSACTMLLSYVPRERLCVTGRARLGFHAAWFPDMAGGRVVSRQHTQRLHDSYPAPVRHWIARRGGLTARMLVLEGAELRAILPPCRYAMAPQRAARPSGHALEIFSNRNGLAGRL
jgi:hypothetical protein